MVIPYTKEKKNIFLTAPRKEECFLFVCGHKPRTAFSVDQQKWIA